MAGKEFNTIEKIKTWASLNENLLVSIFILATSFLLYFHFTKINKNHRQIDSEAYTSEVELISIDFKKVYEKQFYGVKLDRIVFDLKYFHKGVKYQSKATIYWEYLTPTLNRIIENEEIEKLTVKCKETSPEKATVLTPIE